MVSYEVIESIVRHVVNNLDPKASFGRPRTYDICKVWYRIQRMLRSSQPWSMMEEPDLSHKTLHRIFIRWCRLGVFKKIHSVILKLYRMKHPLKSDRYKTSKMCPCGHPSGTLKDWNLPSGLECRLRCHQTTSTDSLCPLNDPESIPASTDLRKFDRDELATMWIAMAGSFE